jgi:hypothetical protein
VPRPAISGYSGTPLAKKLEIRAGSRLCLQAAPGNYRELALPMNLVDIKVCALDATWSGLKLVVRENKRTAPLRLKRTPVVN